MAVVALAGALANVMPWSAQNVSLLFNATAGSLTLTMGEEMVHPLAERALNSKYGRKHAQILMGLAAGLLVVLSLNHFFPAEQGCTAYPAHESMALKREYPWNAVLASGLLISQHTAPVTSGLLAASAIQRLWANGVGFGARWATVFGLALCTLVPKSKSIFILAASVVLVGWMMKMELIPLAHRVQGTEVSGTIAFVGGLAGNLVTEWM